MAACARCHDTGARYHRFHDATDRSLCDCPMGDWLRIPEATRNEILAYIRGLEVAQRTLDRHARRDARRAAAAL